MEKYNLESRVKEVFEDMIFTNKMEEGEIEELVECVKEIVKEIIQLDREIICCNVRAESDFYRGHYTGYATVDRDSIINAPLPEGIEEIIV